MCIPPHLQNFFFFSLPPLNFKFISRSLSVLKSRLLPDDDDDAAKARRQESSDPSKKKKAGGKKAEKATAERKTGFLDLPPEIRNQIYHLALVKHFSIRIPDDKEEIEYPSLTKQLQPKPPVVLHEPPILATTRQIRSEALQVFYANNTFVCSYGIYGPKLVRQLGPERTAMLTSIQATDTEAGSLPYMSTDRWQQAVLQHVNNLSKASGGRVSSAAVLVPKAKTLNAGAQRIVECKDMKVDVRDDGVWSVKWVGRQLEVSLYDYW